MTRAGSTARGRGSSASATPRLRSVPGVDTMDNMVEDKDRDTYFQHTTTLSLPSSEMVQDSMVVLEEGVGQQEARYECVMDLG